MVIINKIDACYIVIIIKVIKQDTISPTDSAPQITTDQDEAVESNMKIPMIAVGALVAIVLAGAAIVLRLPIREARGTRIAIL